MMLLDLPKARGSVVQQTREHHASHAFPISRRRRAERHVDAGTLQVFLGTMAQANPAILQLQVIIRRRYIYPADVDLLSIHSISRSQRAGTIDHGWENAFASLVDVQSDEDGCGQIRRQTRCELLDCLKASRGGSDHDNVAGWHSQSDAILRGRRGCGLRVKHLPQTHAPEPEGAVSAPPTWRAMPVGLKCLMETSKHQAFPDAFS